MLCMEGGNRQKFFFANRVKSGKTGHRVKSDRSNQALVPFSFHRCNTIKIIVSSTA